MVLKTHKRRELLMIKHAKRPKKYKVLEKLKKLGIKKRRLTNKELELLFKGLHVKYCRNLEDNIINDSYIIANLQKTIAFQQKTIEDQKEFAKGLIDKYEDEAENYQKANTQLALNVDELKTRLFGKFERKLKDFALRPDKKKDN